MKPQTVPRIDKAERNALFRAAFRPISIFCYLMPYSSASFLNSGSAFLTVSVLTQ